MNEPKWVGIIPPIFYLPGIARGLDLARKSQGLGAPAILITNSYVKAKNHPKTANGSK